MQGSSSVRFGFVVKTNSQVYKHSLDQLLDSASLIPSGIEQQQHRLSPLPKYLKCMSVGSCLSELSHG